VVSEADIERCGRALVDAAPSPATVIVFGSYARGTANDGSDLDFLVIEPEVASRAAESARLRGVLPRLDVPVDVIVLSEEQARRRAQIRGSARDRARGGACRRPVLSSSSLVRWLARRARTSTL
jgi:predicted nucleotidyltransferase